MDPNKELTYELVAGMIDHSLLQPHLSDDEIEAGCALAAKYGVATVCVRPSDVLRASQLLQNTKVKVSTVIGFPHGAHTPETKMAETREAIEHGAVELDVVLHIGKLKSGEFAYVQQELQRITTYAHARDVKIKVIFENCYLTEKEKIKACEICNEVGVDWVKTSTGYGTSGATDADLILMRKYAKPTIQVKAAGGVRTLERAAEVINLGVTRIGATATAAILDPLLGVVSDSAEKPENDNDY